MKKKEENKMKIEDHPSSVEMRFKDARNSCAKYSGIYELSTSINGKPSYESGLNTIWYKQNTRQWVIGTISNMRSGAGEMVTKDQFEKLPDVNGN